MMRIWNSAVLRTRYGGLLFDHCYFCGEIFLYSKTILPCIFIDVINIDFEMD